ncbi:MAG: hypothetical protein E7549_01145 [Ruminococcaceae bacterium]|nr:hypothetical protein [Oscillospiraceae bacterium]
MKKWCSIFFAFLVLLLSISLPVFASSETIVDSEGWVVYTRLNAITATYKVVSGQNESYLTKSFADVPLPYGPKLVTIDNGPVQNFWITTSIQNVDMEDPGHSSIVTVPAGESCVLNFRVKIWNMFYPSEPNVMPIDSSLYECRVYLDDNYTRYLSPEVTASASNGAELYYSFTNNTDSPVALSRVSIGMFEDSTLESYGFQFYVSRVKYRMFTSSQMSTQAIVDSIQNQTDQITGSIDGLGDQIGGSIENSTDQIINGWDGGSTSPDGSDVVGDLENIENDLLSGAQAGLDSLGDFFTDTTTFLTSISQGFVAVNTIFVSAVGIDVFSSILTVSLSLGLFSFLLGVVPGIVSSFSSRAERQKWKEYRSARMDYWRSRGR